MIRKPDSLKNKLILLAPMAGVTDKPFRQICRDMGADAGVSEMISSNINLYNSNKSKFRRDFLNEMSPRIVQIAGADPVMMAEAAKYNVEDGADIIDINMGCPAKKVCNVMAGSYLLKDEMLVGKILEKVVNASSVPVTLKIRTGWDNDHKNAVNIAKIAELSGVQRLTVHGRTRACRFTGRAEHETTAEIKSRVSIEVIANGDIDSASEAERVLASTQADGVMIGRAAIGNPWLFTEVRHYLQTGTLTGRPNYREMMDTIVKHLRGVYHHYGEFTGVRIARKHIIKYCRSVPGFDNYRMSINKEERCESQLQQVKECFYLAESLSLAA
jgi:tRNA-dihydrouridine synthase B